MRWIEHHRLGDEHLNPMFDSFQVVDRWQPCGLIGVDMEGLIYLRLTGDPSPYGEPVNTMDEAISEMLP